MAPPVGAAAAAAFATHCTLAASPWSGDVALWMAAASCRSPSKAGWRGIAPAAGSVAPLARLEGSSAPDTAPSMACCASGMAGTCGLGGVELAAASCQPATSNASNDWSAAASSCGVELFAWRALGAAPGSAASSWKNRSSPVGRVVGVTSWAVAIIQQKNDLVREEVYFCTTPQNEMRSGWR